MYGFGSHQTIVFKGERGYEQASTGWQERRQRPCRFLRRRDRTVQ